MFSTNTQLFFLRVFNLRMWSVDAVISEHILKGRVITYYTGILGEFPLSLCHSELGRTLCQARSSSHTSPEPTT